MSEVFKTDTSVRVWFAFIAVLLAGLFVATDPFMIINEPVTVTITAIGDKNPSSKGSEVWLVAFGEENMTSQPVQPGWEKRGDRVVSYQGQPSVWVGKLPTINRTTIELAMHPWSGLAEVNINGVVKKYDLYSETGGSLVIHLSDYANPDQFYLNDLYFIGVAFILFFALMLIGDKFWFLLKKKLIIIAYTSKNLDYMSRLDHLRFVAASLVVLYHFFSDIVGLNYNTRNPILTMVDEGHTGVALFMVLSGMVFGLIGYRRKINYFSFIFNRIVRIYPLREFHNST